MITQKRAPPEEGNLKRAKGTLDGSASMEKRNRWKKIAKKPRKFS
jgi:hypothetical protein